MQTNKKIFYFYFEMKEHKKNNKEPQQYEEIVRCIWETSVSLWIIVVIFVFTTAAVVVTFTWRFDRFGWKAGIGKQVHEIVWFHVSRFNLSSLEGSELGVLFSRQFILNFNRNRVKFTNKGRGKVCPRIDPGRESPQNPDNYI